MKKIIYVRKISLTDYDKLTKAGFVVRLYNEPSIKSSFTKFKNYLLGRKSDVTTLSEDDINVLFGTEEKSKK